LIVKILALFQELKRIFGICPCCGEPFRLSDAMLFTKTRPPETEFDKLDRKEKLLDHAIELFDEAEGELRARAISRGQSEAGRALRRLTPGLTARGIHPQDVRVIFTPVKYVAFRGMTQGDPVSIDLIDKPAESRAAEAIHRSIEKVIKAGKVVWRTYRISDDGSVSEA
jgi:predicted Holliday junction resolvase-like endonuclease